MSLPIGSVRLTADGFVGQSGKKIRVYEIIVHSGASAGTVQLRNGTDVTGTEYDEVTGTAAQSVRIAYAGGLLFPDGCFYDEDANIDYSTIIFEQESA